MNPYRRPANTARHPAWGGWVSRVFLLLLAGMATLSSADAETRDFRKLLHDLLYAFHVEIAGKVRAQSGQVVRGEKLETPLAELREIAGVYAKTFERAPPCFG